MSYLKSLNPMLFKNIAHIWSFKHLYFCIFKMCKVCARCGQDVCKMCARCVQGVRKICARCVQNVCKMCARCVQDVCKICARCVQGVLNMCARCMHICIYAYMHICMIYMSCLISLKNLEICICRRCQCNRVKSIAWFSSVY